MRSKDHRLLISVVISSSLTLGAISASYADRFIAAGGNMGGYYQAYFVSKEDLRLGESWIANIKKIGNDGTVSVREYIVNCNNTMPHVVTPFETTFEIDLYTDPPSATQLEHEIWYAVCVGNFGVFSYDEADNLIENESLAKQKMSDGSLLSVNRGNPHPMEQMRNLIPIEIVGEGKFAEFSGPAVLYCSTSVPTLYFPKTDRLFEISVIDNTYTYSEIDQELALAIHQNYCRD